MIPYINHAHMNQSGWNVNTSKLGEVSDNGRLKYFLEEKHTNPITPSSCTPLRLSKTVSLLSFSLSLTSQTFRDIYNHSTLQQKPLCLVNSPPTTHCLKKYVGVQSWKAAYLPTLEIRVKQNGNRVMKVEPYWEKNKNKKKKNSAKK